MLLFSTVVHNVCEVKSPIEVKHAQPTCSTNKLKRLFQHHLALWDKEKLKNRNIMTV